MYPYNTAVTETPTEESCQDTIGAKTFFDTLPSRIVLASSFRRVLANSRGIVTTTGSGYDIPFLSNNRYWDTTNIPNDPDYTNSNGVSMNVWYNQANSSNNIVNNTIYITQGLSASYQLITGTGIFPGFQINIAHYNNVFDKDFTWVCLMRASSGDALITSANWRTTPLFMMIDGQIGTGNNDLRFGIGPSAMWVGMGTSGGADTFFSGTYPIVNGSFADPKLIVLRRDAATGTVKLRVNKIDDGSAIMTTGSLSGMGTITMKPQCLMSEFMIFDSYLSDSDLLSLENNFQSLYDLSI